MRKKYLYSLLCLLPFLPAAAQPKYETFTGGHSHSIVLCSNGSIFSFGNNSNYELGRDSIVEYDEAPAMSIFDGPPIRSIHAGFNHNLALACDSTVWAWGNNQFGQSGYELCLYPTGCKRAKETHITGGETGTAFLQNIIKVQAGRNCSYALTADGNVLAWGDNEYGQLGIGTTGEAISTPVYVLDSAGNRLENVIDIAASEYGAYLLIDTEGNQRGQVFGIGKNDNQMVIQGGATLALTSPAAIRKNDGTDLDNIASIYAGATHGLFLDADSQLWAIGGDWGEGQLGISEHPFVGYEKGQAYKVLAGKQKTLPGYESRGYLSDVVDVAAGIAHSLAIVECNGVRYMMGWGDNESGQLGTGDLMDGILPHFVMRNSADKLTGVQSISAGANHSMAKTFDPGTNEVQFFIFGNSEYGQVGDLIKNAVTYPKEFIEPDCPPASNCPVADIGPDTLWVCHDEMDSELRKSVLLHSGNFTKDAEYHWSVKPQKGLLINDASIISRFLEPNTNGAAINAYFEGTYYLTVKDKRPESERLCERCPDAYDSIVVAYKKDSFTFTSGTFSGSKAPFTLSNANGNKYAFFGSNEASEAISTIVHNGGDLITSIAVSKLEKVETDLLGEPTPEDSLFYRAWVEDISDYTSIINPKSIICGEKMNSQTNQAAQQIKVDAQSVFFESLKFNATGNVYQSVPKEVRLIVLNEKYDNGRYLPDFNDTLYVSSASVIVHETGELELPVNLWLEGDEEKGRSYWIMLDAESYFNIARYETCNSDKAAAKSGPVENVDFVQINNTEENTLSFYDMKFNYSPSNCGRTPLMMKYDPEGDIVNIIKDTACGIYIHSGIEYTKSGIFRDTLSAANGVDSISILDLLIRPTYDLKIERTVDFGKTYIFGDHELSESGTYKRTFKTISGCDSTVTLSLTISPDPTAYNYISETACGAYYFDGIKRTQSGEYRKTLKISSEADSVVVLQLTIMPEYRLQTALTVAYGETHAFGDTSLATSGVYTRFFTTQAGCDSIVTLNFTVAEQLPVMTYLNDTSCGPYTFAGKSCFDSGTYTDSLTAHNGADSIVVLKLTIGAGFDLRERKVIMKGESYLFGKTVLTEQGIYRKTFQSMHGCDSTVTLSLFVASEETNKHAPQFTGIPEVLEIKEDISNNTVIANIQASDADGDELSFGLSDPSGALSIEPATGILSVQNSDLLDYEQTASHTVVISVSDGDITVSKSIQITLIDIDDPLAIKRSSSEAKLYPTVVKAGQPVFIETNGQPTAFQISSVLGQTISSGKAMGIYTINTGCFKPGVYIITLFGIKYQQNIKIIVK